jgi:hypothetical protein
MPEVRSNYWAKPERDLGGRATTLRTASGPSAIDKSRFDQQRRAARPQQFGECLAPGLLSTIAHS